MKLVVFDLDGTLIDSAALIVEGFAHAFEAVGRRAPTRAEMLSGVGLSLPEAMARLMPGASADEVGRAVQAYREEYVKQRADQGAAAVPLFAGARAALEGLAARPEVLIGVATGMARRGLDHALAVHGLDRLVVTRQSADTHPSKPHPSMLEAALAEAGVAPGDAAMVGDTTFDIEMAGNAGVPAVGVDWGHHPASRLRDAGAAAVISDFAGLVPALEAIWGEAL